MRAGMGLPKAAWRRAIGPRMILGIDYAGTVVATGEGVAGFRVGDEVMGAMPLAGTYADYLTSARATRAAPLPRSLRMSRSRRPLLFLLRDWSRMPDS